MLSDGDFYIWCDTWSGNFGGGDSTGVLEVGIVLGLESGVSFYKNWG